MNKIVFKHMFFTLLALTPLFYLGATWNRMPEQVATHFAADGSADGFTSKSALWLFVALLCGITIGTYFLIQYINRIDPKRRGKPVPPVFNKIAAVLVLFLTAVNLVTLVSAAHPEQLIAEKTIVPLIGLLLAVLGNYMYSVKHNYFVGIKVPWALASEYNWRKTHQLGGMLWMAGGLLILFASLLLPKAVASVAFNILLAIMVIIPSGYSFILFKREGGKPHYFDKTD